MFIKSFDRLLEVAQAALRQLLLWGRMLALVGHLGPPLLHQTIPGISFEVIYSQGRQTLT